MPPLTEDELRKEQTYGKLAMEHARITGRGGKNQPDLPVIKPDSAEWEDWQRYFVQYLGFEPLAMKRVRWGLSKSVTVPSERPEDFDAGYLSAKTAPNVVGFRDR
jgi:hypothetical protein